MQRAAAVGTLGPLERRVLEALRAHAAGATVRDICPEFPSIAYTTLSTTLERLRRKGLLAAQQVRPGVRVPPPIHPGGVGLDAVRHALTGLGEVAAPDVLPPILSMFLDSVSGSDEATMGNATTLLPSQEIQSRQPANLTQALETVAGVSTVSEGHAAVPAIRGLARGRTLILLDGARVTSDRRVGPSATFLESVRARWHRDRARARLGGVPLDAFGGVIYARTRRIVRVAAGRARGRRAGGRLASGAHRGGNLEGLGKGGVALQAHYRDFDDYRSPQGDVFNSGATDRGSSPGAARDRQGRARRQLAERLRPRHRPAAEQLHDGPVLLPHRGLAPLHLNVPYLRQVGGFERVTINTFVGSYRLQVTDQDRYATATRGRTLESADYDANDFQVRTSAERLFSRARFEMGFDVNGRFNVHATDTVTNYALDGSVASEVFSESIEQARRNDTGAYASVEAALNPKATVAAGIRGDYVSSHNSGGYFGDPRRRTAPSQAAAR